MRVLVLIDVFGWAFEFVARGIRKYSKHAITIKRWTEVTREDNEDNFDVLFCMNSSLWSALLHFTIPGVNPSKYVKTIPRKCIGIRAAVGTDCDSPIIGWNVGCVSQKIYDELKAKGIPNLFLTRNGVDVDVFKPAKRPENHFVVGWAGNHTRVEKRFNLLRQIGYPMLIRNQWGRQFFIKGRERGDMVRFYGDIDAFINVSDREGMPQSILEAAATGLPIVVTDTGGMPEFVDREWVVPVNPEEVMLREMNGKLKILKENPKLRSEVGTRNLYNVLENWTWQKIIGDYDKMFESFPVPTKEESFVCPYPQCEDCGPYNKRDFKFHMRVKHGKEM